MDTLIVILIVGIAIFFIGKKAYTAVKGKGGCSCGCSARSAKEVSMHCGGCKGSRK